MLPGTRFFYEDRSEIIKPGTVDRRVILHTQPCPAPSLCTKKTLSTLQGAQVERVGSAAEHYFFLVTTIVDSNNMAAINHASMPPPPLVLGLALTSVSTVCVCGRDAVTAVVNRLSVTVTCTADGTLDGDENPGG